MILILCLDDNMGMAFNGRRQSRDKLLISDIAALTLSCPLHMHPRSAPLFENSGANIVPHELFHEAAQDGEYCFLEFSSPAALEQKTEKLIIYRWNRRYQSDLDFDIDLGCWKLEKSTDFPGSSHEKITREEYIRE